MAELDENSINQELLDFREGFKTVLLSTASRSADPECSYAPFVLEDGAFYIYVSMLASHTRNLLENPQCSVLFIEDESASKNIFARRRLGYRCSVTVIARDNSQWNELMDQFTDRFGKTVDVLRGLADFHLICLRPESGQFVKGFSQAFALTGEAMDRIEHINPAASD
ncbi:MAG: pyridoxamine 5'-phosphate oxidase family protein [Gammaproteobacteria bacterium]